MDAGLFILLSVVSEEKKAKRYSMGLLLPWATRPKLDILYPVEYNVNMRYELHSTNEFKKWFSSLKDVTSRRKLLARLDRIENGNFGDNKQLGNDLFELRFFFGAGFRIYYTVKNETVVLLLVGGDKASQKKNIARAEKILQKMEK